MIKKLLKLGANETLVDNKNRTIYDMIPIANPGIAELIKSHTNWFSKTFVPNRMNNTASLVIVFTVFHFLYEVINICFILPCKNIIKIIFH